MKTLRDAFGVLLESFLDPGVELGLVLPREWKLAGYALEQTHSCCPYISLGSVVRYSFDDFGAHVRRSSTEDLHDRTRVHLHRKSEVYDLHEVLFAYYDVLELDVPVDNVLGVAVLEPLQDLLENDLRMRLGQHLVGVVLEDVGECRAANVLHEHQELPLALNSLV